MNPETFAVIGYGSIGKRHAGNLALLRPKARIVLVDPIHFDGVEFPDTASLLQAHPHLTGALICSPHAAHLEALERLTALGVPVYLEKPVCAITQYTHARTYQRIDQASRHADRVGMGFQYRYHSVIDTLYPQREKITRLDFEARDNLVGRYGPTVLETMASHSIDLALWLLGPAYSAKLVSTGLRASGHILHENGKESHFLLEMDQGERESVLLVHTGDEGYGYTIDADAWMYQRCLNDWLAWVLHDVQPKRLATLKDGLAVQNILGRATAIKPRKVREEA